jgi:hypothetical protein
MRFSLFVCISLPLYRHTGISSKIIVFFLQPSHPPRPDIRVDNPTRAFALRGQDDIVRRAAVHSRHTRVSVGSNVGGDDDICHLQQGIVGQGRLRRAQDPGWR